jgi:hypothetical protein
MKEKQAKLPPRRLYRRKTTMEILDCSLNRIKALENSGILTKIRLGRRDIHHLSSEVDALAAGQRVND